MFRVSNFARLAASAKNAISSREAATTQQNLEIINASVQKLAATFNGWNGSLISASSIASDQAKLEIDIKNAVTDANKSEIVTAEEAQAITAYIRDTLEPSIQTCMAALQNKKAELTKIGLKSTVQGDMDNLRTLTNGLGDALLAKAPESEKPAGVEVNKKIDGDFEVASTAFKKD